MLVNDVLLPDLKDTIKIPEQQAQEFRDKGHIIVRNILSDDEVKIPGRNKRCGRSL